MKRWIPLFLIGLMLCGALLARPVVASPLASLPTATPMLPTAEPPTAEPPTATPLPPTAEPPSSDPPTAEPPMLPTVTPTTHTIVSTAIPVEEGSPRSSPTPTVAPPTATPLPPTATPQPAGAITIEKLVNPRVLAPGDTVVFTLRIVNTGVPVLNDVVARDSVPAALEVIDLASERGDVVLNGQVVTAYIGTLAPGEVVTVTITARVRPGTPAGTLVNTAQVTTSTTTVPGDPSGPPASSTSSVTVEIVVAPPTAPAFVPQSLPITAGPTADPALALLPWVLVGILIVGLACTVPYLRRRPKLVVATLSMTGALADVPADAGASASDTPSDGRLPARPVIGDALPAPRPIAPLPPRQSTLDTSEDATL